MSTPSRTSIPLVRYRLTRGALDFKSFTVAELASMTQVPINTVYSFLSELGTDVTQESLPSKTPGRPRKIYTLTGQGVERLRAENFEVTRALREAGIGAPAGRAEARPSPTVGTQANAANAVRDRSRAGMNLDGLRNLYVGELKNLYSAERQVLQVLPRMAKKASSVSLRAVFEEQLEDTEQQLTRLDQIFEGLGRAARGRKCRSMQILLEETKERMQEDLEPEVLDAALVSGTQKAEHYEIAGYGTVQAYAELLGENEAARLLQKTLDEKAALDRKLATQLIEVEVCVAATG
jgi:ferritin-like metal-binding protein YciE